MAYQDRYRDPRWQKLRLQIFERDRFACLNCTREDQELHAHHWYYCGDPWDTPPELIWTLCGECHKKADHIRRLAQRYVAEILATARPPFVLGQQHKDNHESFISWLTGALMSQ